MGATRLIVNADDLGMSRAITNGIVSAHRWGFLTSASLMTNMPGAEYAIARVIDFPSLGVGVHLNICSGRPILPPAEIRSLVDANGQFHRPDTMVRRLYTGRARPGEIFAEFTAQIRWMKERGVVPTHADSHHHMHLYPAAVLPFVRALKSEAISCARAPRCTVWRRGSGLSLVERAGGAHEGPLFRRLSVRAYRSALQFGVFRGLRMPSARVSFHSHDRHDLEALGEQWKIALLNPQPGAYEFTCHPGLFEPGFSETDRIGALRVRELEWLTSSAMRRAIDSTGIQLINYRELSESVVSRREPRHASVLT
jgi:predicted glycoside hydrolase/deacetylase ChbG (UPF0249 family)